MSFKNCTQCFIAEVYALVRLRNEVLNELDNGEILVEEMHDEGVV